MATTKVSPSAAAVEKIMEIVKSSKEEARKFTANPKSYLESKGVATEGMKFTTTTRIELSKDQLDAVSGGISIGGNIGIFGVGVSW